MASNTKPAYQIPWEKMSQKDFDQYIKGCFYRVKTKDHPSFRWKFCDGVVDLHENIVDFGFPPTGIYNFRKEVVGFYRTISRQWKRGIYSPALGAGNSIFWLPIQQEFKVSSSERRILSGCLHQFPMNEAGLNELFSEPKYVSFDKAYESIEQGEFFARAISRDIFLTVGASQSLPMFWWGPKVLGFVSKKKEVIPFNKKMSGFISAFFGLKVKAKEEKHHHGDDNANGVEDSLGMVGS